MRYKILYFLVLTGLLFLNSCELLDTKEAIPSYISVDKVTVTTEPGEGTAAHNISDCWVSVNNELIGIFEVPFTIPVLHSGECQIVISPGIKQSGVDAKRVVYPMMTNFNIDTVLVKKEIVTINPKFRYRPNVVQILEDFEVGNIFEVSEASDTMIYKVSGEEAFEGHSMAFFLDDERFVFECRSNKTYNFPKTVPVYLEIHYKNTDPFVFGLFALESGSEGMIERRIPVFTFNPSPDKWRKTYIELNYHLISATMASEFRMFFTCIRPENAAGDLTKVYIDNIKILHN